MPHADLPVGHDKGHQLCVQLLCVCVGVPDVRVISHERKDHVRVFSLDVSQVSVHSLRNTRALEKSISLLFRPEEMKCKLLHRQLETHVHRQICRGELPVPSFMCLGSVLQQEIQM